jgi:hypothetical protein
MHGNSESQVITEVLAGDALSLAAAAKLLPSYRHGKPTNPATLWRWASKGVRLHDGTVVRLETCRCGGRQMTSRAALARFIEAQTPRQDQDPTPVPAPRTPTQKRRTAEHAARELDRIGL